MAFAEWMLITRGLDKDIIGSYLGKGQESNIRTLKNFVHLLDFTDLEFDKALYFYLSRFRLPGEA